MDFEDIKIKMEKTINTLLTHKPFYANFFLNSTIMYDKYNIPTAAASVTKKGPILIFNSEFLSKLQNREIGAVIEHEVLHLIFEHCNVIKTHPNLNMKMANIAMDCSINQYIEGLPSDCVTLSGLSKILGIELEPEQTWEYYYSILLRNKENLTKNYEFDSHSIEGLGELVDSKASPEEARAATQQAIDQAIKASKGNVPQVVLKTFDQLSGLGKVPWQQVLSNFIARSVSVTQKNTRKKTNRRFGIDQPGKKRKRELTLGVCLDSSGSVSSESFELFLNEVGRLSKLCNTVYLIDADCKVHSVEVLKKGKGLKFERRGNGGTMYQPGIEECLKYKCDAIVYFGDGDSADKPENPRVPFLWALVGDSKPPGDFGGVLRI